MKHAQKTILVQWMNRKNENLSKRIMLRDLNAFKNACKRLGCLITYIEEQV